MPWIAQNREEDTVTPNQAEQSDNLTCPDCGAELYIRDSHKRNGFFVARHFVHKSSSAGSCGGESSTHKKMKSIAVSKIRYLLGDYIENISTEESVGKNRVADIKVSLSETVDNIKNGRPTRGIVGEKMVIEVQYNNKDKNLEGVTNDYLRNGYSVLWLWESQFTDKNVRIFNSPADKPGLIPVYPGITRIQNGLPDTWKKNPIKELESENSSRKVTATFPAVWFKKEIQSHLVRKATNRSTYKQLAILFPDKSTRFANLVEDVLKNPDEYREEIDSKLGCERVCGNCRHSQNDEYRDGEENIVCWKNTPDKKSNRPRKLNKNSSFAEVCPKFSPYRETIIKDAVRNGIDSRMAKYRYRYTEYSSFDGDEDIKEFALRLADTRVWGNMPWYKTFSPQRAKKLAEFRGVEVESIVEDAQYNSSERSLGDFMK